MKRALITGAAGFIGSHVCEALLADGWQVTGLDSFDDFYPPAVKRRNLAACLASDRFRLVECDIRNAGTVKRAADGVEVIVHLAARAGVRPSIQDPLGYEDVNVGGTCVLLEAARWNMIQRFIFASSSSVYGDSASVPFAESELIDFPISPYAATKRSAELLCHAYHHLFGIDVTCLRFFTVYGPRQRPDLAIHKFANLIDKGRPVPMFGDGTAARDYTYVGDIVAGVLAAIERCRGYRVYNLGSARPISLNDLITAIESAVGRNAVIARYPAQPGDAQRTWADLSLAERELGYWPETSLATGLATFVKWMREDRDAVAEERGKL
jgi:UDP-glucuronate 4-epimerase